MFNVLLAIFMAKEAKERNLTYCQAWKNELDNKTPIIRAMMSIFYFPTTCYYLYHK